MVLFCSFFIPLSFNSVKKLHVKISLVTLIITRRSHLADNDFIISTLNISAQQIRSLSTVKKDQKFYIRVFEDFPVFKTPSDFGAPNRQNPD